MIMPISIDMKEKYDQYILIEFVIVLKYRRRNNEKILFTKFPYDIVVFHPSLHFFLLVIFFSCFNFFISFLPINNS